MMFDLRQFESNQPKCLTHESKNLLWRNKTKSTWHLQLQDKIISSHSMYKETRECDLLFFKKYFLTEAQLMYKLQAHNIVIHNFQRSSTYSVKYWLYPPLYNIAVAYFILNNSYLFISYRYIVRSLQSPHWQQFVYSPHL